MRVISKIDFFKVVISLDSIRSEAILNLSSIDSLPIFKRLFRKGKNMSALQKTGLANSNDPIASLELRIKKLDQKIVDASKEIFYAQSVQIRSILAGNTNIIEALQRKIMQSSANNSVLWHRQQLFEMNAERRALQANLDRLTGQVWKKRIRR